jgi:hypothetical protein
MSPSTEAGADPQAERIIGHVVKNSRDRLEVAVETNGDGAFMVLRQQRLGNDGNWRPDKQRVSFRVTKLPDLVDVLDEACELLEREGLVPREPGR